MKFPKFNGLQKTGAAMLLVGITGMLLMIRTFPQDKTMIVAFWHFPVYAILIALVFMGQSFLGSRN